MDLPVLTQSGAFLVMLMAVSAPAIAKGKTDERPDAAVCPHDQTYCRTALPVGPAGVRDRLGNGNEVYWTDGDTLIIAARREAQSVQICCALQESLDRLGDGDIWAAAFNISRLDEAMLDLGIVSVPRSSKATRTGLIHRGENARPPVPRSDPLTGALDNYDVPSPAFGEPRTITIYTPPNGDRQILPVVYLADGQSLEFFAQIAEALASACEARPVLLVGLWNQPPELDEDGQPVMSYPDGRSRDYLWGADEAQFRRHEAFLIHDVMPMAEESLGGPGSAENRMLFGFSSGAAWAVTTALRNSADFRYAAGASLLWREAANAGEANPGQHFFLGAGYYEPDAADISRHARERIEAGGAQVDFNLFITGHSEIGYAQTFAWALREAFPATSASCEGGP